MSLPSRDYYLQLEGKKFLSIDKGQIKFVDNMSKGFNFHSWDQAEQFIQLLVNLDKVSVPTDLEVYRY